VLSIYAFTQHVVLRDVRSSISKNSGKTSLATRHRGNIQSLSGRNRWRTIWQKHDSLILFELAIMALKTYFLRWDPTCTQDHLPKVKIVILHNIFLSDEFSIKI